MSDPGKGIRARFRVPYGNFLLDLDLQLPGRGVTGLLGHSGSGKTTFLRCVAGLERAQEGFLEVNGEPWQDSARGHFLPTHRRALGYVFQEASLFEHLSVRRNLEYGLKRIPARERKVALDQALELLGIGHLLDRMPARLSGGERQRVGLARALVSKPPLLLCDEPTSSLDASTTADVLRVLADARDKLGTTVVVITHDLDVVKAICDRAALLEKGRLREIFEIEAAGPRSLPSYYDQVERELRS